MSEKNLKQLQLELGGSFFELIEFTLTRRLHGKIVKGRYGVNVAKVREVVRMPKINPLASRVRGIAGVFELRGVPIPAVDLAVALGDIAADGRSPQQIIVTEFSRKRAGFIVDSTNRIRRVAWDKVLPPSGDAGAFMSGMTLVDNNEFLFILDLERILMTLEHQAGGPEHAPATSSQMPRNIMQDHRSSQPMTIRNAPTKIIAKILLVDDSTFIRNGVKQLMERVGYEVVEANNGAEALDLLERGAAGAIDLVVCDVEMPRMDGLSFTRKMREHAQLSTMPIVLHTSLSGRANQEAGMLVGANGYVTKNDFRSLFELIREILGHEPVNLSA